MADNPERNVDAPEYLKEKHAAETRQGSTPEQRDSTSEDNEQAAEQKIDTAISNTFQH